MTSRLTPLESELRGHELPAEPKARRYRFRRRRTAQTRREVLLWGLARIVLWLGVGSALALIVAEVFGRGLAFGFYVVGAFLMLGGVFMSTGGMNTSYYMRRSELQAQARRGLVFLPFGVILVLIGVALDTL